jgi:hypothetical protein
MRQLWTRSGADWYPKFWWDIFLRGPKKNADQKKKKSLNKNYEGQIPLSSYSKFPQILQIKKKNDCSFKMKVFH